MRPNRIEHSSDPEVVPERKRASKRRSRNRRTYSRPGPQDARDPFRLRLVAIAALAFGAALVFIEPTVFAQGRPQPDGKTAGPSFDGWDVLFVVILVVVNGLFAMAEAAMLSA